MCPLDVKKTQMFQGFYPSEPSPGRHHELVVELTKLVTPTYILQLSKTQSLFKTGHW